MSRPTNLNKAQALYKAINDGDIQTATRLLEEVSTDVRIGDDSLLHAAVRNHNAAMVSLLLQHGADPYAQANMFINGKLIFPSGAAITQAVINGDTDVVNAFLDHKINISPSMEHPVDLLDTAIRNGHADLVKLFIEKGTFKTGEYLHTAAQFGQAKIIEILANQAKMDVNAVDMMGYTPLDYAARKGSADTVKTLIQEGAEISSKALHLAAVNDQLDVVKLLLDNGADVNAKDKMDLTPLHYAAENGHLEVMQELIEREADVNSRSHHEGNNKTPLGLAASNNHRDAVTKLIAAGAHVDKESIYTRSMSIRELLRKAAEKQPSQDLPSH